MPIAYVSAWVSLAKLHVAPFRNSTITMTIAFAIVFSVLLAISVWLIEKRSAWKKAGKFFLYGLGVVVVVPLLGWGGYEGYEKLGEWNTARLVRNGSIDTYLGVRLGMTEQEVTYLLGAPALKEKDKDKDDPEVFFLWWKDGDDFRKGFRIKNARVKRILCYAKYSYDCPSLGGIKIGDDEAEVIKKLGRTLYEPNFTDEDPPRKRLEFGTSKRQLRIFFTQGKVDMMVLNDN